MHEKKDTFQYIPLEKGLKALLKNKEINRNSDEVSEVISIPSCHACIHPSIFN